MFRDLQIKNMTDALTATILVAGCASRLYEPILGKWTSEDPSSASRLAWWADIRAEQSLLQSQVIFSGIIGTTEAAMTQVAPFQPRRGTRGLRPRISYEEFLKWDGENQHVEWVDGEVIPMPPTTGDHSTLGNYLITLFTMFLARYNLGELRADPFQMKTGPDLPGRAPDILFVTTRSSRRLHT